LTGYSMWLQHKGYCWPATISSRYGGTCSQPHSTT
jgi:hypothetical protein